MKKMDRRSCENTGITKHIENKTGAGCSAVGESDELRQLDELHHRLKLNRKDLKRKPTSNEAH